MELKLTLEQTGESWTLRPKRHTYVVGSQQDCTIVLPYDAVANQHIEFTFDDIKQIWYVDNLAHPNGALIDHRPVQHYALIRQTRIELSKQVVLIATPVGSTPVLVEQLTASIVATRLLSGSAYRQGMLGGFFLLNRLRSDPYKSRSPETGLDLNEIARHASQSIALSLVVAIAILLLWVVRFLEAFSQISTYGIFGISSLALLFSSTGFLDWLGAFVVASERVLWRWLIARQFLKRNYRSNFRIDFLNSVARYFQKRTLQPEPLQNVITFSSFKPFLGAGVKIFEAAEAIERKPKDAQLGEDIEHIEIPVYEFYQAIDKAVASLKMPNLEVSSQLFVNGFELDSDGIILPQPQSRPTSILPEQQIWTLGQSDLSSDRRMYRVYRYIDTARDSSLSCFVRFYNIGGITYYELSAYLLLAIDRRRFSLTPLLSDNLFFRLVKTTALTILLVFFKLYLWIALWYAALFIINVIGWWRSERQQRLAVRL